MTTRFTPLSTQEKHHNFVALILTFFAINALMIYLVYSNNIIFGSKAGNWDYPFFKTIVSTPIWIPLAVFLILLPTIFIGSKWINSHEKLVLVGCFFIALAIQILINRAYPYSLGTIVKSDVANSFYSPAMSYSPVEILREYETLAPSFPLHARSNMPGKILLFQFIGLFTSAPQKMGYLVIALSSLGAIFLYGICVKLYHNKLVGLYAFILYALIPGKIFFFPILNIVTPVFILACLYLFLLYIEQRKSVFLWLLGLALFTLILFEPTPLVTGIIFLGILLYAFGENKLSKKDIWPLLIYPLLGFLGMYLIFRIVFSLNLLSAFQYVLNDAVSFNITDQRNYWIWVIENPKEFLYSAGIPVMILFIYLASDMISQLKILGRNLLRWPIDKIYILSLSVTIFVLILLGINRGETTRLWIYLAVLFQVPAAYFLAKIEHSKVIFYFVACTLVIQCIVTLQRVGFVVP
jgi:hypothetical protein